VELLILGVFTAFNFLILKIKLESKRIADFFFDLGSFIILTMIFGGTLGGMTIAMVAGFIISITLLMFPPKVFKDLK